ncbi:MAG TPA: glycerol-3-phosphate 1-O-acyltransferase PlsY [Candidatus Hydrogenedentes bacterium]|jgi:glycerol-3-phosphate acyltransferase PlsY|nr:glycerol-3-phosphate 1-O-acyltransferase PlsY [Candidatus Hydrogenedentota bacterium]OQC22560.1 MAG: Glycerol-3-phosphate acyltransferase [Verrucomicrobia bacterium ADurb.Bin063]HOC69445.1 glycerol-3-phosphate 1-O-acyltransferase PlsY [Candidatus Hydrogenedentota bacterium]HOH28283.1 glycerol-3-phosphate 1-O-acyltransferase PlsY [Candidatus Hydrogenedentota bacterium]
MTGMILIPIALCLSFVFGSIPTGYWLGLAFCGKDIRKEGSGNIGATNTMRCLGKGYGALALAFDVFKGWVAVVLFAHLYAWTYLPVACGLAAILGHTFSLFVRFRGGKGVATSAGVFIGLAPFPAAIAGAVFLGVVVVTRMVSAGSVAAAVTLAVTVFLFPLSAPVRAFTVLVALLILIRHQSNLRRIWRHEEPKL